MFYIIYKTINLINNKFYIGKHQTKNLNDNYMGSGKHLKYAIYKYGIENFKKEILFQFDNETDMNAKEAELVTEEFCLREDTYNICVGGKGGFSYIRKHNEYVKWQLKGSKRGYQNGLGKNPTKFYHSGLLSIKDKLEKAGGRYWDTSGFTGKKHSDETKNKISKSNSKMTGSKNSQFGTMWITNGQENKKIKKDVDFIPEGWRKGRCLKL